jgi:hypothetical protein
MHENAAKKLLLYLFITRNITILCSILNAHKMVAKVAMSDNVRELIEILSSPITTILQIRFEKIAQGKVN